MLFRRTDYVKVPDYVSLSKGYVFFVVVVLFGFASALLFSFTVNTTCAVKGGILWVGGSQHI